MKKMCSCSIIRVCGGLGMTRKKNSGGMLVAISVFEMPIVLLLIDSLVCFKRMIPVLNKCPLGAMKSLTRFFATASQSQYQRFG